MSLAARLSPTGVAVASHRVTATSRDMDRAHDRMPLGALMEHVDGFVAATALDLICGMTMMSFVFADDDDVAAATAATADRAGAIVHETAEGWSAVEPLTDLWKRRPGAHVVWRTRRLGADPLADGRPSLRIEAVRAISADEIASVQGWQGWAGDHEVDPDGTVRADFVHAEELGVVRDRSEP